LQAKQLEDALSSSHRSLAYFGIGVGQILRRFGVFNISINSLHALPYASFDLSPVSRMTLVIYPHFDQIASLLIHLDSLLHDFSKIIRSTFHQLSFGHIVSVSSNHSSQADILRSLDFSITHKLRQIQGHVDAVLSFSLPDLSDYDYAQHVDNQWDAFYGALLDLQHDFNDFSKSVDNLLSMARQMVDRSMSVVVRLGLRLTNM
jgi:hypothetical protein